MIDENWPPGRGRLGRSDWVFVRRQLSVPLRLPTRLLLLCGILSAAAGCRPSSPSAPVAPPAPRANATREAGTPSAAIEPRAPAADDWFEDLTASSGVRFSYRDGQDAKLYTILETVGGGAALFDFDGDDDLDLFFPGGGIISAAPPQIGGLPPALYRNEGDWKFVDVTPGSGLEIATGYTHGATVADFDRDGRPDLCVTGYRCNRLYHNEGGGRFRDVTEAAGVSVDAWSTAAAWADFDRDGWPDLYLACYVDWRLDPQEMCRNPATGVRDACPPQRYAPAADQLFRNRRDGTFERISDRAGLRTDGKALGVVAADCNRDGWIDFYVANDQVANVLYLGGPELPFREVGVAAGVALNEFGVPEGSMGVDYGDYDGDGRGDLWVVNFELEDNSLYRNEGEARFSHATVRAGLAGRCRTLVGFGTGFTDFDSDGRLDLFVINGHVAYHSPQSPYRQLPALFQNIEGGRFRDITPLGGPYFSTPHAGRGAAVGDLDNDGAPDLVIVHQNEPVALLRNRRPPVRWLRLELRGTESEPHAVGAVVRARYAGRELVRDVHSGGGYLSQFDRRILLPADAETGAVTVQWLTGRYERFEGLQSGKTEVLIEGKGIRVEEAARTQP